MRKIIFLCGWLVYFGSISVVSASPGLNALDHFFNQVKTFEARFGQIILDENIATVSNAKGRVWIKRPGLFRWDYEPPEEQQIVGDGHNVWVYDVDLEQVSLHDQQAALGVSPASILAGDGDFDESYTVEDVGTQGRFDWVNLIAKNDESNFKELRLGFEDNQLRLLELIDSLDQRTRINFVDLKINTSVSPELFDFSIPENVDVIDNTQ